MGKPNGSALPPGTGWRTLTERVGSLGSRLRHPRDVMNAAGLQLDQSGDRLRPAFDRLLLNLTDRLTTQSKLLQSVSYKRVLERGFALVRDAAGNPVLRAADATAGAAIDIEFTDGAVGATVDGVGGGAKPKAKTKAAPRRKPKKPGDDGQGSLL